MNKKHYHVQFDNNEFWEDSEDELSQIPARFADMDIHANGFKWSMLVKGQKQRKRRPRSIMTNSVYAMLDYVKAELKADAYAMVYVITPDVEVAFGC